MAAVAVIDTGICNLRSVTKALEAVGAAPRVVRGPAELKDPELDRLVLPGVGALRDCVASLRSSKLDHAIRKWIDAQKPFLGVCLGMQALFESSEEGGVRGLGVVKGRVRKFSLPPQFKVPHMGWNTLRIRSPRPPLLAELQEADSFYFVHSYYCDPEDRSVVLAECDYGGPFPAVVGWGRDFATQFHPEKSQAKGLMIYRNFTRLKAA